MYLQFVNDSSIQGYYFYHIEGINFKLTGELSGDNILLFEKGITNYKSAFIRGKIVGDAIIGISNSKKNNKPVDVNLHRWTATGDIYAANIENKSLVFCSNDQSYIIPFSQYLDNRNNYTYVVLFSEMINHHFYSLIRFFNYPDIQQAKAQYGWPDTEHFLLYSASNENGEIENVQTIKIGASLEKIFGDCRVGSIIDTFKDSLNIDVVSVKEKSKTNLAIGRSSLMNGISIKKSGIYIPDYLFDIIELKVDDCYDLIIRYKLSNVYGDLDYIYQVDSVYELNNLNITKLDSFCNDLKQYEAQYENGLIKFGDYSDIKIEDYNFDGIDDIYIFNNINSGNGIRSQTIWLYNQKENKFIKDAFLSGSSLCSNDKAKKIITFCGNGGGGNYGSVSYQMRNGKFVKIASLFSSYNQKGTVRTIITGKLSNHKWIERKRIKKIK
ncbi:MAG TPA: hypothetical protein VFG10_16645 [Saprospiraceae bacterium]|nr:hypothetical protein [Saprospiraceae bacterium]